MIQDDIQTIAKKSSAFVSTIYRVVEKLGLSGLNQLKSSFLYRLKDILKKK